ncbi:hypothetical protein Tsubulata_041649 [Turnera subulata]|uniref:DUF4283 domain-containing protein n=1 Tax=Turnera subulata TaxID=218843 RepID=A0A9Q0GGZ5_9ROSI|nr:hypothetical protein Tsubulata_041649 [Turnera subulata]
MEEGKGRSQAEPGVMFIPTTKTMQWLSQGAVGVLKNTASTESVQLLWILHGMREVEVAEMGGDRVLVTFLTKDYMWQFLKQQNDWIPLWFVSFNPWQNGDKAVNRHCWISVRGIPLNIWCKEFFEMIGSVFGSLVRIHPETEQRQKLGAARLEIITTQEGAIAKELELKVVDQSFKLEVLEATGSGEEEDSSISTGVSDADQFEAEESGETPVAGGEGAQFQEIISQIFRRIHSI